MPLFYHKYVNYVLAHSVNYVITLYSLPLPLHRPSPSPQPSQKDNNPSLSTMSLPPLSKVRCCRPKKFGRLPEGLPHHVLASLVKGEVLSPEKFGRLPEGLLYTHQPLHPHNPLKTTSSLAPHYHPCL